MGATLFLLLLLGSVPGATADGVRSEYQLNDVGMAVVSADPDGNVVIGGRGDDIIRVEGAINRVDGGGGNDRIHFGAATGELHVAAGVPGSRSELLIDAPFTIEDLSITYLNGSLYIELPEAEVRQNVAIIYGVGEGSPGVIAVRVGGRTFSIGQLRARAVRL